MSISWPYNLTGTKEKAATFYYPTTNLINNMTLEIAVFNIESAIMAANAGADRIELCENPFDGGTTPSYGTLKMVREKISIPVFPIIRPRGGDFLYSDDEFEVLKRDVELVKQLDFPGLVTGMLHKDGSIDVKRTTELVKLAGSLQVTFHRAFDRAKDPLQALEDIIQCGCKRILTSGQVPNAFDNKELIKELAHYTGVKELHSSARKNIPSAMQFTCASMQETLENMVVDEAEIKLMKSRLQ